MTESTTPKPRRRPYRRSRSTVIETDKQYTARSGSKLHNQQQQQLSSSSHTLETSKEQVRLRRSLSELYFKDKSVDQDQQLRKPPRRLDSYHDDSKTTDDDRRKKSETSLDDLIRSGIEHDREQAKVRWGDSKAESGLGDSGTLSTFIMDSPISDVASVPSLEKGSSHQEIPPTSPRARLRGTVKTVKQYIARSDESTTLKEPSLPNNGDATTEQLDESSEQTKEQGKTSRARKSYSRIKKKMFGRQDSRDDQQQQGPKKQENEQSTLEVKENNQTLRKSAKKKVRKVVDSIIGLRRMMGSNESSDKSQVTSTTASTAKSEENQSVGGGCQTAADNKASTRRTVPSRSLLEDEEMDEADDIYVLEEEVAKTEEDGQSHYTSEGDLTYQADLESYQMSAHSSSQSSHKREANLASFSQKELVRTKAVEASEELDQIEFEKRMSSSLSSLHSDSILTYRHEGGTGLARSKSSLRRTSSNVDRLSGRKHGGGGRQKMSSSVQRRSSNRETTSTRRESRREDENCVPQRSRRSSRDSASRDNIRLSNRSSGGERERMAGSSRSHGRRHKSTRHHEHRFTRRSHGMWRCRCGAYDNGHKDVPKGGSRSPPRGSTLLADGSDIDRRQRKFERSSSNVSTLDNSSRRRDMHRRKHRRSSTRKMSDVSERRNREVKDRSKRRRRRTTTEDGAAERRHRSSREQNKHRGSSRRHSNEVDDDVHHEDVVDESNVDENLDLEYQSVPLKGIEGNDNDVAIESHWNEDQENDFEPLCFPLKSGGGNDDIDYGLCSSERSSISSSVDERWRVNIDRSVNIPPSRYESIHSRKKEEEEENGSPYRGGSSRPFGSLDDDYESSLSDSDSSVESFDVSEHFSADHESLNASGQLSVDLDRRRDRANRRIRAHQRLRRHSFGSEHDRACKDRLMDILISEDIM